MGSNLPPMLWQCSSAGRPGAMSNRRYSRDGRMWSREMKDSGQGLGCQGYFGSVINLHVRMRLHWHEGAAHTHCSRGSLGSLSVNVCWGGIHQHWFEHNKPNTHSAGTRLHSLEIQCTVYWICHFMIPGWILSWILVIIIWKTLYHKSFLLCKCYCFLLLVWFYWLRYCRVVHFSGPSALELKQSIVDRQENGWKWMNKSKIPNSCCLKCEYLMPFFILW